jgi:hypothetical protein
MRKIILGAAAGAISLMAAVAPASALSSYTIQSDGGANFDGSPNEETLPGGLTIKSTSKTEFGGIETSNTNAFGAQQSKQQNLSGDMSWEGTGYYLRPDR